MKLKYLDNFIVTCYKKVVQLYGYHLKIASTPSEIETACKLRRRVFAEEGLSDINVDLYDEYDNHSVFFLCYYKNTLVGAYRQIVSSCDLQVFKAFNTTLPPSINLDECSELSGLVIKKDFRKNSKIKFTLFH